ncbi:type IV secretory pathway, VirD4 component [Mycobacteroides abscessus subsp. abscessus]|uniref:hypothetical protein n=1 Tax=Mycobacteroides abscessus TaxID=36809 RepID=UPI0009A681F3|nr:hypothetical protein [Mycobacteroides abscessus]SLI20071.1 type IV secretory pathway, VirD4 component [Mycobacteroides abscessus subsp. abscessus]
MAENHPVDPIAAISNVTQALSLADELLTGETVSKVAEADKVWSSLATLPLAAILYFVSPACATGGGGIERARNIARYPEPAEDSGDDDWITVATRCDHPLLAERLRSAAGLSSRQRGQVVHIITQALAQGF